MLAHLADVSIRSILLALPAATVLWILQSRRTAALQHAVWAVVVCGMLALFAFGQALPRLPLRILDRPAAAVPATPPAVFANPTLPDEASEAAQLLPRIPAKPSHSNRSDGGGRPGAGGDERPYASGASKSAIQAQDSQ
jgi:hypothetical protein